MSCSMPLFFVRGTKKEQLSVFQVTDDDAAEDVDCLWKLYIDGAARNNPGPAGAGVYLTKDGAPVAQESFFLGSKTNNQAEYLALLLGIYTSKKYVHKSEKICIISDSQLLVRQMNAQYKVRDHMLLQLRDIAFDLLKDYSYCFCHVFRTENKEADKLANRGIDYKKPLPDEFLHAMRSYGIHL